MMWKGQWTGQHNKPYAVGHKDNMQTFHSSDLHLSVKNKLGKRTSETSII